MNRPLTVFDAALILSFLYLAAYAWLSIASERRARKDCTLCRSLKLIEAAQTAAPRGYLGILKHTADLLDQFHGHDSIVRLCYWHRDPARFAVDYALALSTFRRADSVIRSVLDPLGKDSR